MVVEKGNGVLGRYESLKLTAAQILPSTATVAMQRFLRIPITYMFRCTAGYETCQII